MTSLQEYMQEAVSAERKYKLLVSGLQKGNESVYRYLNFTVDLGQAKKGPFKILPIGFPS